MTNVLHLSSYAASKKSKNAEIIQDTENTGEKSLKVNNYFWHALNKRKDIDPSEVRFLMALFLKLDFEKDYDKQTYFHSVEQWSEELGIGKTALKEKIKSLAQKGLIAISSKKGGPANTYAFTSTLVVQYLAQKAATDTKRPVEKQLVGKRPVNQTENDHRTSRNPATMSYVNNLPNPNLPNVCKKPISHTENLKVLFPDLPSLLIIDVADFIQKMRGGKTYCNPEAGTIITEVLEETSITVNQFKTAFKELKVYDQAKIVFEQTYTDTESVISLFISWCSRIPNK